MRKLMQLGVLAALMICGMVCTASADPIYPIDPSSSLLIGQGYETGVPKIEAEILANLNIDLAGLEAYKADYGVVQDSGYYANSYETQFNGNASGGTISNFGNPIMSDALYLLVKDGNHSPSWYLFNLQDWNGTDQIVLSNFWNTNGAISHVAIYAANVPVPEPNSLLLLGSGILALGIVGRRWFKS
jgi:hypothetical protein